MLLLWLQRKLKSFPEDRHPATSTLQTTVQNPEEKSPDGYITQRPCLLFCEKVLPELPPQRLFQWSGAGAGRPVFCSLPRERMGNQSWELLLASTFRAHRTRFYSQMQQPCQCRCWPTFYFTFPFKLSYVINSANISKGKNKTSSITFMLATFLRNVVHSISAHYRETTATSVNQSFPAEVCFKRLTTIHCKK